MERQNITLSLPKALLKKAKTVAIMEGKSLSDFLKITLEEKIKQDTGYLSAKNRQISLMEKGFNLGTEGQFYINREKLHERR
jgi:hypothetical protein